MVYKKGIGLICNGCDLNVKCFGVKVYGGEIVIVGFILICQCGIFVLLGINVGKGKDDILFVFIDGIVKFELICCGLCNCKCINIIVVV